MSFLPVVVGHEDARERLRRFWDSGRLPTGLLITGPKGRGKRTLARAFAWWILRQDEGDPEREHSDLRVVGEDDRDRLIGVESIRQLREWFSLTPVEGERQIGLIVDADRLSEESANALLKLLEEPPPGGHLILTARSRESLLETIRSRCQHLAVGSLGQDTIAEFLRRRGIADEVANGVVAACEGSLGLAVELATEEGEESILEPLDLLCTGGGGPLARSRQTLDALKQKGEARARLRLLLLLLSAELRSALRGRAGLLPSAPFAGRPGPELEAALRAVLHAWKGIDRNVGPDLLLDELAHALPGRS